MNIQTLYDSDFNSWIQQHIVLLKESRLNEIDTTHLIEELEDMGKSNKRELKSRLRVLIAHLLQWQHQAEQRSTSWESSIREHRKQLSFLLKDIPSLKNAIDDAVVEIYDDAVEWASDETAIPQQVFPALCPYTQKQLLDKNFYPCDNH
jgi:predicted  nucleic acid-binding Zn-ribbon protein